jgi:hypothetical protein
LFGYAATPTTPAQLADWLKVHDADQWPANISGIAENMVFQHFPRSRRIIRQNLSENTELA